MHSDTSLTNEAERPGARPLTHPEHPIQPAGQSGAVEHDIYDEEEAPEEHIHLPPPTMWPITTAFGVAIAGGGLVTDWPVTVVGGLVALYGIVNWVQELRHELH